MCVVPALAGDAPKYVGDVWVVEEEDLLALYGVSTLLGVFDTLEGARKFSEQVGNGPNSTVRISKTAYYTTKWSNTNEE